MTAHPLRLFSMTAVLAIGLLFVPSTAFAQDDVDLDDANEMILAAATSGDSEKVTMEDMRADDADVTVEVDGDDTARDGDGAANRSWVGVIGRNALWGGITGGLVGLGVWLVTGRDFNPWYIANFAGGGILVGTAVGLISLATMEDPYASDVSNSVQWIERDMPRTYDVGITIDF